MSENVSAARGSAAGSAAEGEGTTPTALRVLSGSPTDEELAALIAVLTAVSSGADEEPPPPTSRWAAPGTRLRSSYGAARGGWRASGLPR